MITDGLAHEPKYTEVRPGVVASYWVKVTVHNTDMLQHAPLTRDKTAIDSTEHAVYQNEVSLQWQSCSKQKINLCKKTTQMAK